VQIAGLVTDVRHVLRARRIKTSGPAAGLEVVIHAGPVACPGHPHELLATSNTPGGVYTWSIASQEASLTDGRGARLTNGNIVFLEGIDPEKVRVTVRYTVAAGVAQADARIRIHPIDFEVIRFDVVAGMSEAVESANGLQIRQPPGGQDTFAVEAAVKINVDPSCPRRDECARNHRVGWLQTLRANRRVAKYPGSRYQEEVPLPIRDATRADSMPPFYDGDEVYQFLWGTDQLTTRLEDNPETDTAGWLDDPSGLPPGSDLKLEHLEMSNEFTAWLVVQNIEWAQRALADSFDYLRNLDWRCGLKASVDHARPIGSRATPRRAAARDLGMGGGRGTHTPKLDAPTAKSALKVNRYFLP
jgi:hypothetical protein